jgi:hypothetical protein
MDEINTQDNIRLTSSTYSWTSENIFQFVVNDFEEHADVVGALVDGAVVGVDAVGEDERTVGPDVGYVDEEKGDDPHHLVLVEHAGS